MTLYNGGKGSVIHSTSLLSTLLLPGGGSILDIPAAVDHPDGAHYKGRKCLWLCDSRDISIVLSPGDMPKLVMMS